MRKGYKNVKYAAMLFCVTMLINQYKFVPEISYLNLKNGYGFIVRNKWKTILISSYDIKDSDEKEELQGRFFVDEFITNLHNNYSILIGNKYLVLIPKGQGKNKIKYSKL